MADNDALPSVVEFTEDVSLQEAPPVLPPGTYNATCTRALVTPSKSNPENHLLNLEFTIAQNEFPADFAEAEDVKLYWNRNTVNKNTAKERWQLKQLGEKMKVHIGRRLDCNDFIGKQVKLKVKNGAWQGVPRAEIDAIETE